MILTDVGIKDKKKGGCFLDTHPFPRVPHPHLFRSGLSQHPEQSGVHGDVEAKNQQTLQPHKAPHPWHTTRVGEGEEGEGCSPGQPSAPQGDERVGEEGR